MNECLKEAHALCRNLLMLVTSSFRPSKIGGLEKTVAAFRLAAWCADFGTQGGAKMGIFLGRNGRALVQKTGVTKSSFEFSRFLLESKSQNTKQTDRIFFSKIFKRSEAESTWIFIKLQILKQK